MMKLNLSVSIIIVNTWTKYDKNAWGRTGERH